MFSQTIDPQLRFRQAVQSRTASLSYIQRLSLKLSDLRNTDPATRQTSLALAAIAGRTDVCLWLIEDGHDDDEISADASGETIAHIAAGLGHLELLEIYLDQYPFVLGSTNLKGATALHIAAMKDQLETAEFLLAFGSDPNAPDLRGETPLHYASAWGKLSIVKLLIEAGCDYSAKNNQGFTASEYSYSFAGQKALEGYVKLQVELVKRAQKEQQQLQKRGKGKEKESPKRKGAKVQESEGLGTTKSSPTTARERAATEERAREHSNSNSDGAVGLGFDFPNQQPQQPESTLPNPPSTPPRRTTLIPDASTTTSPLSIGHSQRTISHDSEQSVPMVGQHSFGGLEVDGEEDDGEEQEGDSSDQAPSATLSPPPSFHSPVGARTRKDSTASHMSTNSRMARILGIGKKS